MDKQSSNKYCLIFLLFLTALLSLLIFGNACNNEDIEVDPMVFYLLTTGEATNITSESAQLNGSISTRPDFIFEYYFEYGISPNFYESKTPILSISPNETEGMGEVICSAIVTGLSANQTYCFRIRSPNDSTSFRKSDEPSCKKEFTTLPEENQLNNQ